MCVCVCINKYIYICSIADIEVSLFIEYNKLNYQCVCVCVRAHTCPFESSYVKVNIC